tara:strand:- start:10120 stop:10896 length:777 start_codon:yes stop_codon:yes gene_type:complete
MTTIFTSHKLSLNECPKNLQANLNGWDSLNPSYGFKYYNDEDMNLWMKDNLSKKTFTLFSRLNTGAGRADMFRICHLHAEGGVWVDTDLPAFDINEQQHNFQQLIKDNQVVLVRNRRCDNPRYTFIGASKGNALFSMLEDSINHKIEDCIENKSSTGTIDITGPFTLHEMLLEMCGFEHVIKAGPRTTWPQGFAFTGTIDLNKPYKINNAKFIYINDVIPEVFGTGPSAYQKENVYEGYESDLTEMKVVHHDSTKAVE